MAVQSFQLGRVVITPNALRPLTSRAACNGIRRATGANWTKHDRQENDAALRTGLRLLSAYRAASGVIFWIITESSREVTTLLMPDDY